MKQINIDIETFSSVDLSKAGVYRYADSSDFEILLFGYAVDMGEVQVIDLASGEKIPEEIIRGLSDPGVLKYAYNAQFERVCLGKYLGHTLDPASWRCTMVASLYLGLPAGLAAVGTVLGLEKQKLSEGKDLIKYFSVPCKPTKTNGGRTRNLPSDAPEKWQTFKIYNCRDVETEMEILTKVSRFPVPDFLWNQYATDQQINDRGIEIDRRLAEEAIRCDEEMRDRNLARAQELTGLDNPNSPIQLKDWLAGEGVTVSSLSKKEVAEVLKSSTGKVKEVLELRQLLSKSSVRKYDAMRTCTCSDGRAHGLLQFYGANRTGRWAGRLVQVQNLPQNHLPDLENARNLVKSGDFELLDMLYDSVPNVLSELIRTAFVPKKVASSSWPTTPLWKPEPSHGWQERSGGWRSLRRMATFIPRRRAECSTAMWRRMVRTDTSGSAARSLNWRLAMVAAQERWSRWERRTWAFRIPRSRTSSTTGAQLIQRSSRSGGRSTRRS